MASNHSVSESEESRKPRRIESFTILFMVALGWTCSSSHGGSGSSGDKEDPDNPNPAGLFQRAQPSGAVSEPAPANEE